MKSYQASLALGLEQAQCHFQYILLVKINHKASSDKKGRKLQSHIERSMNTKEDDFLQTKTNFCKQPTIPGYCTHASVAKGSQMPPLSW